MSVNVNSCLERWTDRLQAASADRTHLRLRGSGSKDFYGQSLTGEVFDTREYSGIVAYEPTELVVTARCGTPLAELEEALAEKGQSLAFEPPHFGTGATVGGCVASGLSGPRRAQAGALRDFVLGVKILNGQGELLNFGGQVMKNVAGYDVSRLMAGSLGTLGLIVEVSLKVLPVAVAEQTLRFELAQDKALGLLNRWGGQPLPISASAWGGNVLHVRLSGATAAVSSASRTLGGQMLAPDEAKAFWLGLREQRHDFFDGDAPLWRISVPSTSPALNLPGARLVEWGGALRWLRGEASVTDREIRQAAERAGGHAALFRADAAQKAEIGVFQPLSMPLARIQKNLKHAFDPQGIFNRGRMYSEF